MSVQKEIESDDQTVISVPASLRSGLQDKPNPSTSISMQTVAQQGKSYNDMMLKKGQLMVLQRKLLLDKLLALFTSAEDLTTAMFSPGQRSELYNMKSVRSAKMKNLLEFVTDKFLNEKPEFHLSGNPFLWNTETKQYHGPISIDWKEKFIKINDLQNHPHMQDCVQQYFTTEALQSGDTDNFKTPINTKRSLPPSTSSSFDSKQPILVLKQLYNDDLERNELVPVGHKPNTDEDISGQEWCIQKPFAATLSDSDDLVKFDKGDIVSMVRTSRSDPNSVLFSYQRGIGASTSSKCLKSVDVKVQLTYFEVADIVTIDDSPPTKIHRI